MMDTGASAVRSLTAWLCCAWLARAAAALRRKPLGTTATMFITTAHRCASVPLFTFWPYFKGVSASRLMRLLPIMEIIVCISCPLLPPAPLWFEVAAGALNILIILLTCGRYAGDDERIGWPATQTAILWVLSTTACAYFSAIQHCRVFTLRQQRHAWNRQEQIGTQRRSEGLTHSTPSPQYGDTAATGQPVATSCNDCVPAAAAAQRTHSSSSSAAAAAAAAAAAPLRPATPDTSESPCVHVSVDAGTLLRSPDVLPPTHDASLSLPHAVVQQPHATDSADAAANPGTPSAVPASPTLAPHPPPCRSPAAEAAPHSAPPRAYTPFLRR
ncbi:hypothetical protein Agub_g6072, partial [Astrephomene gubernaculifera]